MLRAIKKKKLDPNKLIRSATFINQEITDLYLDEKLTHNEYREAKAYGKILKDFVYDLYLSEKDVTATRH